MPCLVVIVLLGFPRHPPPHQRRLGVPHRARRIPRRRRQRLRQTQEKAKTATPVSALRFHGL